jgi:hypothetical protein
MTRSESSLSSANMKTYKLYSTRSQLRLGHMAWRTALGMLAAALSLAIIPALATASVPSFVQKALSTSPAAEGLASPYGQSSRFGGFDPTGKVLGKFVFPVGFAVAPEESNAVYVLDRVSSNEELGEGRLQYRLQKLSSAGTPLGSVTLPVQQFTDVENFTDANPLISLAVDSHERRVYALVEGIVDSGSGLSVPVAQRLVAWSTEPNKKKELVKAVGKYAEDGLTHAALIAGQAVLQPTEAAQDLYAPAGISVASNHDVVIEAQDGVQLAEGGPTTLQSVTTAAPEGKLAEKWVASNSIAPNNQQADGVFSTTSGFGVDLFEGPGKIARLANVNASLTEASRIAEDTSNGKNRDEASTIDDRYTVNYNSNIGGFFNSPYTVEAYTAGSPVAQLSNGLYAARFAKEGTGTRIDPQSEVEPWNGVPNFWFQGNEANASVANAGIRLFTSKGTVVTTIGGQQEGKPCSINNARLAVAAGTEGSVFVLTQPNEEDGNSGDEVIQFAPGGKGACPQPSGSLSVNGKSGSTFSFPVGTNVTLADAVERKGEAPYRFDWVLLNTSTLEVEDLDSQLEAPSYRWPTPSTSHTFTQKGTYLLASALYGDYGLIQVGGTVEIKIK